MAAHDVPPHDMLSFGHPPDPLDDALRGGSGDPAVDALVRDVRSAYLPEGIRPRSADLAAFAGTGAGVPVGAVRSRPAAPVVEAPVPLGRRAAVAAAAFAATLTGKVVLGGAVAAAALGGLHATDTVDVPLLPRSPQAETAPSTVPELPDAASDPLRVLVGPPVQPPADALERTPAPGGAPAPAAPHPAGVPSAGEPSDGGEIRADPGTSPATPPPTAAPADRPVPAGPAPTAGQPDGPPRAEGAPQEPPADPPADADPGAGPAAGADQDPLAPNADQQKTSARP